MRFEIEGREYDWDGSRLTVAEAMLLKDHTGMGMASWNAGLVDRDGYAEAFLIFLAKRRAGEAVRWQDLSGLNLATLRFLPDAPEPEERPSDEEGEAKRERPDPTRSGGKTRRRATSATS